MQAFRDTDSLLPDVVVDLLGKAGVTEPDGHPVGDDLVEGFGCGDARQVVGLEREAGDDGVADSRCGGCEYPLQTLGGAGLVVLSVDVLQGDTEQSGREER